MENINEELVKEAVVSEVCGVQQVEVYDGKSYVQQMETDVVAQPSRDETDFFEKEEKLRNAALKEAESLRGKCHHNFETDLIKNVEDYDKFITMMLNDFERHLQYINSHGKKVGVSEVKPSLKRVRDFFRSYVIRQDKVLD